ncbi:MAG: 23S rRNA (uracil(1939)-C(5))-methyltransferase RlmD [Bacteroidetes bacterium]|nr:23S rRNA (uracil(1939)-C(5))-methyltransferase RlmD [Bacteroidota bacterium]
MKKGDLIELTIEDYAFEGKGIARIEKEGADEYQSKYVIFVNGAYPGDKVQARLLKVKKSFAEAKCVQIIDKSDLRTMARCKFFGSCGGCKQQDLEYEHQIKFKSLQVENVFKTIGGFTELNIEELIPSEKTYFYRNKMEFSFSKIRWLTLDEIGSDKIIDRNFALGLHIPRIYDKVLDINECFLQSEESNKILNFTRDFFKSRKTTIYSTKNHKGYLRNLVIRQSQHFDELMVNLVTSEENDELISQYAEQLKKEVPQITTIINNINLKKANVAIGDYEKVFWGDGFINDSIGKYKFRVSANSFFQTNTLQAENLYNTALDFADLKGDEIVYDLYSGTGTISIYASEKAKAVYGFENVHSSIEDAGKNAELNNIGNVRFYEANLYKPMLPIVKENKLPKPQTIIIDPPRNGMHKNTIADVLELSPGKIVYVSCNPATQARDVKLLVEGGYKLVKMKPVDMFPHTFHIENVALLIKKTIEH